MPCITCLMKDMYRELIKQFGEKGRCPACNVTRHVARQKPGLEHRFYRFFFIIIKSRRLYLARSICKKSVLSPVLQLYEFHFKTPQHTPFPIQLFSGEAPRTPTSGSPLPHSPPSLRLPLGFNIIVQRLATALVIITSIEPKNSLD